MLALQRQRDCHQRSPGMAEHHGIAHPKLLKSLREQRSLRFGRPEACAGTLAIAKSRPVEADDAVLASQPVDQTTQNEILNHGAIAVKQDDARRGDIAAFDVM